MNRIVGVKLAASGGLITDRSGQSVEAEEWGRGTRQMLGADREVAAEHG